MTGQTCNRWLPLAIMLRMMRLTLSGSFMWTWALASSGSWTERYILHTHSSTWLDTSWYALILDTRKSHYTSHWTFHSTNYTQDNTQACQLTHMDTWSEWHRYFDPFTHSPSLVLDSEHSSATAVLLMLNVSLWAYAMIFCLPFTHTGLVYLRRDGEVTPPHAIFSPCA